MKLAVGPTHCTLDDIIGSKSGPRIYNKDRFDSLILYAFEQQKHISNLLNEIDNVKRENENIKSRYLENEDRYLLTSVIEERENFNRDERFLLSWLILHPHLDSKCLSFLVGCHVEDVERMLEFLTKQKVIVNTEGVYCLNLPDKWNLRNTFT